MLDFFEDGVGNPEERLPQLLHDNHVPMPSSPCAPVEISLHYAKSGVDMLRYGFDVSAHPLDAFGSDSFGEDLSSLLNDHGKIPHF